MKELFNDGQRNNSLLQLRRKDGILKARKAFPSAFLCRSTLKREKQGENLGQNDTF